MKYMDNAENVMSMAQPIMVDPESICLQLRDHSVSYGPWYCHYGPCIITCSEFLPTLCNSH